MATPSATATVTATTTATGKPAFEFPREYHFPPFFTRQVNSTTRHSQLEKWSSLILAYCAHHRLFRLSLSGSSSGATEELFHNRALGRRLGLADAREVLEFMRREGRAEWVSGGSGGSGGGDGAGDGGGDVVWVYWKTPEEWARELEGWVDATGQKNAVLTLYELTEGETTLGTEFHGLDPDLLQKALQVLVKRGKAQVFGQEDQRGVKFF
ncbi:uncharacterized protein JN550_010751 [Neoarthrinium moseri]|uniref:uncharacterized protein n=1 Tax=Neoarthrinium moseri TaxID=1658444 RepID=UPI001FDB3A77|nr:uncharacterized protein JN550_010751 [Neoarthrinium moseri]KAI1861681.1 hypothetical protein JN550_010751 [Neoarthrinium moseri]